MAFYGFASNSGRLYPHIGMIKDLDWYLIEAGLTGTVTAMLKIVQVAGTFDTENVDEEIADQLEEEQEELESTAEGDFEWADLLLAHVKGNPKLYKHIWPVA